jgi:hypothetical protein
MNNNTPLFHDFSTPCNQVKVICSTNERRSYKKRSVFFVHPLFNGESQWPEKTHLVCRYDEESFDTIPIPLPIDYNSDTNTYTCYGVFCSAACVKAFMESNPVYMNALSMIWLKKMMCEVFEDFEDIVESPPKDLLIKHGGYLTIEQFRQFARQKTKIVMHTMPFFPCALAFELIKDYATTTTDQPTSSKPTQKKKTSLLNTKKTTHNENLPSNIISVPANVGNKWEIVGLKQPNNNNEEDIHIHSISTSKSLFQEYLENKTSVTTTTTNTNTTTDNEQTNDTKLQKKRGRPKIIHKKVESPKHTVQGTLVSFLKH